MSLKAFHVFFVIVSVLCALGFGAWAVADYMRTGKGSVLALGILLILFVALNEKKRILLTMREIYDQVRQWE